MITLKISAKSLTIRDLVTIEGGLKTVSEQAAFLARFLVDEAGQPVERARALEMIYDLEVSQFPDLTRQLVDQIKAWQEDAVPLATSEA